MVHEAYSQRPGEPLFLGLRRERRPAGGPRGWGWDVGMNDACCYLHGFCKSDSCV